MQREMIKIIQIVPVNSINRMEDGSLVCNAMGLGSDNRIYYWNGKDCLWRLFTEDGIKKQEPFIAEII